MSRVTSDERAVWVLLELEAIASRPSIRRSQKKKPARPASNARA